MDTPPKICKDCLSWWAEQSEAFRAANKFPKREVKYGNTPRSYRCTTHYRDMRRAQKQARHDKYVARTYSLTDGEYETLYRGQSGVCALCNRATGATRKLSVDHDHACCSGGISCGYCVRGLLCRPCNDLLGHARDDWRFFARCIRYLLRPPALAILKKKRPDVHHERAIDTRLLGGPEPSATANDGDPQGNS